MKNINNITQIHTKKSKKVQAGPFYFLIWLLKVEIIIIAIIFLINTTSNLITDKTKFIIKYNIEKASFAGQILIRQEKLFFIYRTFYMLSHNFNLY